MVSYGMGYIPGEKVTPVLILVVMEDGLVRGNLAIRQVAMGAAVLILVVMEDGLVLNHGLSRCVTYRLS